MEGKIFPQGSLPESSTATPSEALEAAYENLRNELASELLTRLKKSSPSFFERAVVELLVKMRGGLGCLDRKQGLISGNLLWFRVMPQPVSAVEC